MPYRTIVIGTDGSDSAAAAQKVAAGIAKACRATLVIVHAAERRAGAEAVLERARADAAALGVEGECELLQAAPGAGAADAVLEAADQRDAGLIVVGSRGLSRTQRILIGSVSHRIAHHAPCDVLVVRAREAPSYERLLIATDGSSTADRACRRGYDLAAKLGAVVTLVFVGHPRTGEIVLADSHEMQLRSVQATFRVEEGDPAERIIEVAEQEKLELVVVGNKGLAGVKRFLLGSVPQKVLEYGGADVLVVRSDTQVLSELGRDQGGIVRLAGRKVAVYRDAAGELNAFSARCTHLGCYVRWNEGDRTWDCPCHGSRFAPLGEVVQGPAASPLERTDV